MRLDSRCLCMTDSLTSPIWEHILKQCHLFFFFLFSQPHYTGQNKAELFRQSRAGRASSVPMQVCLSYFSCCCDDIPRQKQPKGDRVYFDSYFECAIPGDLVQVLEVAGRIASIYSQEADREDCSCPASFLIMRFKTQA